MNSTKCAAFWTHTNIRGGDRIFPCCRFKKPVAEFNGNISEILHLPIYHKLREKSLNGEHIPECDKCYHEEKNGKKSLRQQFNEQYSVDKVELKYLEIGFDNICNLACDGCWEEFSSKWAEIKNPLGQNKINFITTKKFKNIPDTITKVLFLGGEPLMTNRHSKFLSSLADAENISVVYNTNGTFLFKPADIELLKKFKSVEIIVSIDAVGELNNKVRSGSDWNDIVKFIEQLNTTGFNISINSVLHLNNWHGISDLCNFVRSIGCVWTVNVLTYPPHLDIRNLDATQKLEFLQLISDLDLPNKEYIINHIGKI